MEQVGATLPATWELLGLSTAHLGKNAAEGEERVRKVLPTWCCVVGFELNQSRELERVTGCWGKQIMASALEDKSEGLIACMYSTP